MFELKLLHKEAVPAALEKATRYRLLNEPVNAESICLDILRVDPGNQQALVTLLLSLTDQLESNYAVTSTEAREVLGRLTDEYEHTYYAGIICERQAKARLVHSFPGSHFDAYDLLHEAMTLYEKADAMRPAGNDDARLRWNTCARIIQRNKLVPRAGDDREPPLE
jgi:hypothetical protein